MGQYQLWLQHREIDQLLHAQLKALVKELARVDEQISLLANSTLQVDNVIIQALLKEFQIEATSVSGVPVQAIFPQLQSSPIGDVTPADAVDVQDQHPPDSVSAALFTWGYLPNFVSQGIQDSTRQTALSEPVPPTSLSAENLLPTDMQTFVEAHSPTVPETKNIYPSHSIPSDSLASPVDQQSTRVNQVVERWFERRTRFTQGTGRSQEEQKEGML